MSKTHFPLTAGSANEWGALLSQYLPPPAPTGNVYFVSSTSSNKGDTASKGVTPDAPFATIDYAIGKCTADGDDLIVVLPGHVETVTGAAGVALDVAGVTVLGLGRGRQRPKVNFTTAVGASFDVTAARCAVVNVTFKCSIDAQTAMINVQAADFSLEDCEVEFADATYQATLGILTNASADRMKVRRCHLHGTTDAGTATAIRIVGGTDAVIEDNVIVGAFTTSLGGIDQNTTTAVNTVVARNVISNQTASATKAMVFSSSSTPLIVNNRLTILSGTAPITAAAGFVGGNYYVAAAGVTAGTLV